MGKSPNFGSGVASLSHGHVVKCSNSSYSITPSKYHSHNWSHKIQVIHIFFVSHGTTINTHHCYPIISPEKTIMGSPAFAWPWETARPPPASSRSRAGGGRRAPSARPHPADQPWGAWSAAGPVRGLELLGPWRFGHGKLLVSGSFWLFFWWFTPEKLRLGKVWWSNVKLKGI